MNGISKVLTYDPANPYPVLNPNAVGYIVPSNKNVIVVAPYSTILADADVEVLGAGTPGANQKYTYASAKNYTGASGGFVIAPLVDYPSAGLNAVVIAIGAAVYYWTPDTTDVIHAFWKAGASGALPAPGVVLAVNSAAAGAQMVEPEGQAAKKDDKATAREEQAERDFLARQAEPKKKRFFDF